MNKYLIAGLGNIGSEYADTRHNIGFMVLDALGQTSMQRFTPERHAYYAELNLKGRILCLIKPTTYMNLSGKAIRYWMQMQDIPVERLLVVVDDLALPFGKVQLKPKGGDAGHNGLRNIQELLNTNHYARIRFGIGNNFSPGQQVNYVLGRFGDDEIPKLPLLINRGLEMIQAFCSIGIELAMTQLNSKDII